MFKRVLILYFVLLFGRISAQEIEPVVKRYTVSEGICSNELYHSFQDSNGLLWFCSSYGISSFDGYSFRNFTKLDSLPDYTVLSIIGEFPKGRIWFWTMGAKLFYVENDKIVQYKYQDIISKLITNGSLVSVGLQKDGTVRLGVPSSSIKKPMIYEISSKGKLKEIYKNTSSYTIEVFESDIGNSVFIPINTGKAGLDTSKTVHFLIHRANGDTAYYQHKANFFPSYFDLHFRFLKNKFLVYSGENLVMFSKYNFVDKKISRFITSVSLDNKENLIISTYGNGFFIFPKTNLQAKPEQYFNNTQIGRVVQDVEGGFWIPTLSEGLIYWPNISEKIYQLNFAGNIAHPSCITSNGNTVYVGTEEGSIHTFQNKNVNYHFESPKKNFISTMKSIWYDKEEKRLVFSDGTEHSGFVKDGKHTPIKSLSNISAFNKMKSKIFAGYFCGLWAFNSKDFTRVNALNQGKCLRCDAVLSLSDSTGFVGSLDGLWKFRLKGNDSTLFESAHEPANSLLSKRIKALALVSENFILAGTKGDGLLIFDKNNLVQVTQINSKQGLAGEIINKIYVYDKKVWLATNKGVSSIEFKSFKPIKYTISNYGNSDGFPVQDVIDFVFVDNSICVITNEGLRLADVSSLKESSDLPKVLIKEIITPEANYFNSLSNPLNPNEKTIVIRFASLSYKNHDVIKYRYKLEGYDEDWNYTISNSTRFTNLGPGEYKFIIQASKDGINYNTPSVLFISKEPSYYQTWWFRITMFIFILALVLSASYFVFKLLQRKAERKQALAQKITHLELSALRAQMNPHFVFNVIANIQAYIFKNETKAAYKYLGTFAKMLRGVLTNSNKLDISLEEEIMFLKNYLELEKMRFSKTFNYNFDLDEELFEQKIIIPSFMLQPIIENSIKHGFEGIDYEGVLEIIIKSQQKWITFKIIDNGVGLNKSKENKEGHVSMATQILQERIVVYNQQAGFEKLAYKIWDRSEESSSETGTIVELIINTYEKIESSSC